MRRFTDFVFRALVATLLSAGLAHPALACACCSEIGQRIEHTGPMDSYVRAEWLAVRFTPTARLFADAGFPDTVEGVDGPSDQDYRLKMLRTPKSLMIAVTDAAGRLGTIEMQMPKELTRFEVDPREPGVAAHGLGPALYKEWRAQAPATLTGILALHGRTARAELILHGRGRSCTSATDFDGWTLTLRGNGIRFTFLGTTMQ